MKILFFTALYHRNKGTTQKVQKRNTSERLVVQYLYCTKYGLY